MILDRILSIASNSINEVKALSFIADKLVDILLPQSFARAATWTRNLCGSCYFSGACTSARQKTCEKLYCSGDPNGGAGSHNCTPSGIVFNKCCSWYG